MISKKSDSFLELKKNISKEKKIVKEMVSLLKDLRDVKNIEERKMVISQIIALKKLLKETNKGILENIEKIELTKPLKLKEGKKIKIPSIKEPIKIPRKVAHVSETSLLGIEKETLKRLRKKEKKIEVKKPRKPSKYVAISNKMFSKTSISLLNKGFFRNLKRDLIKANLQVLPKNYVSVILFTTFLSVFAALFLFFFFLFFNVSSLLPIVTRATESIGIRFLKVFWILLVVPIGAFFITYYYPSLEKKGIEMKINQELPFVTIHMSAISGSMIEPSKIFEIIISTHEYPTIEKEFIKLMNEINVFGYDLVTALRTSAFNSPSKKLAELFNGLASAITSGGDLQDFFNKRAQSLLFDYRIEREKYTKSAETFMDIYISVVIAAPMILMLLLMMIKISGLGISLSTSMITLIMVLGVSIVNIVFLAFLHLKQPTG